MPEDTNNTIQKSVKISEDDLTSLRQVHGMVTSKLSELGSHVRRLDLVKRETKKLIDGQTENVEAASAEVDQAELVFQGFLSMMASKYAAGLEGKPQFDLTNGVISFG